MRTHSSHSSGQDAELAFPVAATVSAVSTLGTTVLGKVLPGSKSSQERLLEKKRKIREQRQELKRTVSNAERDLNQLEDRLERQMDVPFAETVLRDNAERQRRIYSAKWRARFRGLPTGEEWAATIAERAQQIYLDTANWTLVKAAAPRFVAGGAAFTGVAGIAYSLYKSEI
jgi:hypothetical protein